MYAWRLDEMPVAEIEQDVGVIDVNGWKDRGRPEPPSIGPLSKMSCDVRSNNGR